jgi:hypothetical protein
MILPLYVFSHDLALQRRMDALELLELPSLNCEEVERIELGLMKHDIMWWANRAGYAWLWVVLYKGRLLDRGGVNGIGVLKITFAFFLAYQYILLGDCLAGSLLFEEYKYVMYKYEPEFRRQKISRYYRFLHE